MTSPTGFREPVCRDGSLILSTLGFLLHERAAQIRDMGETEPHVTCSIRHGPVHKQPTRSAPRLPLHRARVGRCIRDRRGGRASSRRRRIRRLARVLLRGDRGCPWNRPARGCSTRLSCRPEAVWNSRAGFRVLRPARCGDPSLARSDRVGVVRTTSQRHRGVPIDARRVPCGSRRRAGPRTVTVAPPAGVPAASTRTRQVHVLRLSGATVRAVVVITEPHLVDRLEAHRSSHPADLTRRAWTRDRAPRVG